MYTCGESVTGPKYREERDATEDSLHSWHFNGDNYDEEGTISVSEIAAKVGSARGVKR